MTLQTQANRIMRHVNTVERYTKASKIGILLAVSNDLNARQRNARDRKLARVFDAWRLDAAHNFFYAKG